MNKNIHYFLFLFFIFSVALSQDKNEKFETAKRYGYIKGFKEVIELVAEAKEKVIKLKLDELDNLIAEIVSFSDKSKEFSIPIISNFTRYHILSGNEKPYDFYKNWLNPSFKNTNLYNNFKFVKYQNSFLLPDSNNLLVEMHGLTTGGESYPYALILFGIDNNRLYLKGILDQIYYGSFGDMEIIEIIKTSEDSFIIIGSSESGDNHYFWGYFWISYWKFPLDLEILHRKKYSYNSAENIQEIKYNFLKKDFSIEFIVNEQKVIENQPFKYGSWKTIEKDTVSLNPKIMEINKRKFH